MAGIKKEPVSPKALESKIKFLDIFNEDSKEFFENPDSDVFSHLLNNQKIEDNFLSHFNETKYHKQLFNYLLRPDIGFSFLNHLLKEMKKNKIFYLNGFTNKQYETAIPVYLIPVVFNQTSLVSREYLEALGDVDYAQDKHVHFFKYNTFDPSVSNFDRFKTLKEVKQNFSYIDYFNETEANYFMAELLAFEIQKKSSVSKERKDMLVKMEFLKEISQERRLIIHENMVDIIQKKYDKSQINAYGLASYQVIVSLLQDPNSFDEESKNEIFENYVSSVKPKEREAKVPMVQLPLIKDLTVSKKNILMQDFVEKNLKEGTRKNRL